jgi:glycosyltransferase involved in cell wall biosynthesis
MAALTSGQPSSIVFLGTTHDNGGTSILATSLADALRAQGHRVEQWYLFDSAGNHPAGTRIFLKQKGRSPLKLLSLFVRVAMALREFKPDALFGLQPLANLMAGMAGRFAGIRNRVATLHNPSGHLNPALMRVDGFLGRHGFYSRIIACAQTVADTVKRNGPAYMRRLTVISNGHPKPVLFDRVQARRELGLPAYGIVLGQIGRLSFQKNQGFSVGLLKDLPDAALVLLGSGPDEAAVKTAIADAGLQSRVHILGALDHARIGLFYAAVDAVLFPSRFEGLSLAAIEALHAGVPPVCSDIPSFREMFRDSALLTETLLVPLDDRTAWAERIRELVSDCTMRARVIAELKRLSPSYSFDKMMKGYLAVLDQ